MNLHRLSALAYSAIATAVLAFACGPAWAQKGGGHGGGHSGGGHGGGEHSSRGGDWHGGDWRGGYWGGYGYSPYYYGGFGRGLFWGGYPYYGRYYGGYYDTYPYGYYDYGYVPDYSMPSYAAPLANAPAPRMNIPENATLIDVRVPINAQVWLDDQKTKQTGSMREFVTPPLNPGEEYSYDIRARWTENGQVVDRHRKVTFHAGDRLMVNLMASEPRPTAEATQ